MPNEKLLFLFSPIYQGLFLSKNAPKTLPPERNRRALLGWEAGYMQERSSGNSRQGPGGSTALCGQAPRGKPGWAEPGRAVGAGSGLAHRTLPTRSALLWSHSRTIDWACPVRETLLQDPAKQQIPGLRTWRCVSLREQQDNPQRH